MDAATALAVFLVATGVLLLRWVVQFRCGACGRWSSLRCSGRLSKGRRLFRYTKAELVCRECGHSIWRSAKVWVREGTALIIVTGAPNYRSGPGVLVRGPQLDHALLQSMAAADVTPSEIACCNADKIRWEVGLVETDARMVATGILANLWAGAVQLDVRKVVGVPWRLRGRDDFDYHCPIYATPTGKPIKWPPGSIEAAFLNSVTGEERLDTLAHRADLSSSSARKRLTQRGYVRGGLWSGYTTTQKGQLINEQLVLGIIKIIDCQHEMDPHVWKDVIDGVQGAFPEVWG